jgi:predicted HicB family RNase H-like nuclease
MIRLNDIPEEDRMKTNFPVRLPKELHALFKAACATEGISMTNKVIELISEYIGYDK